MSYRTTKKLKKESMHDLVITEDNEATLHSGNAELDITGELLDRDYDLVSKIVDTEITDEKHAESLRLITESIGSRWFIDTRKLTRESMTVTNQSGNQSDIEEEKEKKKGGVKKFLLDLLNRFLEWVYDVGVYISSSLKKLTNIGKQSLGHAKTFETQLKKFMDGGAKGGPGEFTITGLRQYLYINDKIIDLDGMKTINEYLASIKDVLKSSKADIDGWLRGELNTAGNYIVAIVKDGKLGSIEKAKKDISSIPVEDVDTGIFKSGVKRKLNPVGPSDVVEKQMVMALPGNAYLQIFNYSHKQGEYDYDVMGARFITSTFTDKMLGHDKSGNAAFLGLNYSDVPNPSVCSTVIDILKESANEMVKLEGDWEKNKREFDKTNKEAKKLLDTLKSGNTDIDEDSVRIAHRLTREAATTNKAMYNYKSYLLKTNIHLTKCFVSSALRAYRKELSA